MHDSISWFAFQVTCHLEMGRGWDGTGMGRRDRGEVRSEEGLEAAED